MASQIEPEETGSGKKVERVKWMRPKEREPFFEIEVMTWQTNCREVCPRKKLLKKPFKMQKSETYKPLVSTIICSYFSVKEYKNEKKIQIWSGQGFKAFSRHD